MYAIKNWNGIFENNRSRQLDEPTYVNWPVRRDSEGFASLMRDAKGMAAFGLFGALVQWFGRQPSTIRRAGVLADDKGPMTPERFAVRTGAQARDVRAAWERLVSVGWLVSDGQVTADRPQHDRNTTATRPQRDDVMTVKSAGEDWRGEEQQQEKREGGGTPAAAAVLSPVLQALHDRGIGEPTASTLVAEGVTGADIAAVERASDAGDGPGLWVNRLREAIAQRASTAKAREAREAARAAFDALGPEDQAAKLLEFRVWAQDNGLECRHMGNPLVAKWGKFTDWLVTGGEG